MPHAYTENLLVEQPPIWLMNWRDALTHLQAETAAGLDALLPTILDKAFKGEL